ncbi:hypothetical protein BR93DRAFT_971089 [Coniochaeta sp. PMI_546]|nr:hypothetical protein BR93DRAFT_971089 [Coniochaeta sp. PMI_546]
MPIFMLQQAIGSMQQMKDVGSRIIEESKKKLIPLILSIVLMAIHFAILGLLVGGFGTGARSEIYALQEAGKARKSLSPSNIAKLGDTFVRNDAKVQGGINACARTS